ncbi:tetratricopeptide repeat protein [Pseudemcibacter aquimaris]|uniref:tetratricopeptide repeat protein n=1 Tax=Pseudemcibacter aquimaris TaxID=2857064 RepID=UPI002013B147|nr:tetratricopeptide repeat protein [Pseudemcibacter aquimaris]MCC3860998.1 sel1 repeat family protein [Pseudemcibacter aquimaris]WDU59816.1 sel1 repeat family protein [Pseudemcibacter aquimaris]
MKKFIAAIFIILLGNSAIAQEQDITPLFKKITEMANTGEAEAAYHLGMFYSNGIGVEQDAKEAFRWFKIAANKNDPLAAYELGAFYAGKHEDVAESDAESAFRTIKKSAQAGYSMAEYDIGVMYLNFSNGTMGARYMERAAKQGHPMAYQTLSLLYFRGDMTARDMIKSRGYLKLFINTVGEATGAQYAGVITQIEENMSAEDIQTSDAFIANWTVEETELSARANKGLMRSFEYAGFRAPQQQMD